MDPISKANISATNSAKTATKQRVIGRPFPKGVSGNPNGRPNKSLMQKALEAMANDKDFVTEWLEAVKVRARSKGMAGVLETREVLDRVDGKVVQAVELEGTVVLALAETVSERRKRLGNGDNES